MLFSDDPSTTKYYEAESQYGKMVLRRAERHDVHLYQLLSGRLLLDIGQLRAFYKQDPRLQGQRKERCDMQWDCANSRIIDVTRFLDEASSSEPELDSVAELLVAEEKRS